MFPMTRIVYAMAKDGVIFKCFSNVWPKFGTPYAATIFTGIIAALLAALFDLDQLADMLSIGTLMTYTFVALCVLLLRLVNQFIFEKINFLFQFKYLIDKNKNKN